MADQKRLYGIDALRGLAVCAMLTQHLGIWLLNSRVSPRSMMADHPIYVFSQGLSGAFVTVWLILPGFGLAYSLSSRKGTEAKMIVRGLSIMGIGYLMNFLTPSWFTWGSWFALHQIGFMMVLAPVLIKLKSRDLMILIGAILAVTVIMQTALHTPLAIGNRRMSDTAMPGGVLRLIFFEGHFPVFPWAAYFPTGILVGRWFLEDRRDKVLKFALTLTGLSALLAGMYAVRLPLAVEPQLVRAFRLIPRIYPSLLPMTLFELAFGLYLILLVSSVERRYGISKNSPIVSLGRISLTVFCLHILAFKELGIRVGFWKTFSMTGTGAVITVAILLFMAAAVFWRRTRFKYSLEWLIRRTAG